MRYSEDIIQAGVILMIRKLERAGHPITCAGDQNAAKRGPRASALAKITGMTAGEPDVRIYLGRAPMLSGDLISVELKNDRGRLTTEQVDRHARLAELGFKVETVKAATPLDAALQVAKIIASNSLIDEGECERAAIWSAQEVQKVKGLTA